ncbi:MAG TPA: ABC transporter ATP-binding protein [Candidatus Limnocylindrales bacterium]|nr:ABC transporter ATP-binding protein [Candidatus Limnocylindrales bacterium]
MPSRSVTLSDVHKSFGEGTTRVHALRGMTLDVPAGQMCAIMGPSGSGKSTILHLAAGLLLPDSGTVRLGDRHLSTMSADELAVLRRREIGIIFQFFNLLPYLTAEENVALPLRLDGVAAAQERERVNRSLELVKMDHRREHRAADLSGGEMQRVAIARALAISPSVVLADEPTGNLDSVNGRQIIELLRDINEELNVTTLVVTHDPVWGSFCDRIVRMRDGQITEDIFLGSDAA